MDERAVVVKARQMGKSVTQLRSITDDPAVRAILVELGWTPPGAQAPTRPVLVPAVCPSCEGVHMTGWQPIETAPKNGTAVLGWDKDEGHYVTWCSEGSWGQSVDDCVYLQFPTHWRPLPPPPEV
jgi:hypothetical protein